MEEIDRHAITGIRRPRGFQPDHLCLGGEVGKKTVVQERQGRHDGEGEYLTVLEGRIMVEMEKAPRQADISNNPLPLVQFPAFRVLGLIVDRQGNYEPIEAPSFQRIEHGAPRRVIFSLTPMQRVCHKMRKIAGLGKILRPDIP